MTSLKICTDCKIEKELLEYSKNGKFYRSQCKKCRTKIEKLKYNENPKKYCDKKKIEYENNKEVILERNKLYRSENSEKYNLQSKNYRENNRELIRERQASDKYKAKRNANLKIRRQTDSKFRLVSSYRSRISELLKNHNKSSRLVFLDCTKNFFYDWIESQFDDLMNWDNYVDYWVLDHVIPIAFFNLDNEIHLNNCFRWYNLQPLKKEENSTKSDSINLEIIKKHQEKINNYGYQGQVEIFDWLRNELKYGNNPIDKWTISSQESERIKVQRLNSSGSEK